MEDQKLAQLIADSKEKVEAEELALKALTAAQEVEFEELMGKATAERLAEVKGLPLEILPYCTGYRASSAFYRSPNHSEVIEDLKKGWRPDHFSVEAPGLAIMTFAIAPEYCGSRQAQRTGQYLIEKIRVYGVVYYEWHHAISAAVTTHRDNQDRKLPDEAIARRSNSSAMKEPSTSDRLVELLGEIVADEVEKLLSPIGTF